MELKEKQTEASLDLEEMRQKLSGKSGKAYWRSLEEVAGTPEFEKFLEDEFPNRSTIRDINRRDLLKFMGAGIALAGLSGCRGVFLPQEKLVPYVKAPEEMVPGVPLIYASSVLLAGYATGVLVEQREGRPIKLEGNPEHPASLGALDSLSQAEILNLYDPDRATSVLMNGDISTWEMFSEAMREVLAKARGNRGAGVRLLTGAISSPTLLSSIQRFLAQYPAARWHSYEPVGRGSLYQGTAMAFGRPMEPVYDFSQAQTILSLDADFLHPTGMPGSLRYAREFSNRRRVSGVQGEMNRLYAIESTPTITGASADHRWPVKPSQIYTTALALAGALGVGGVVGSETPGIDPAHFAAMVEDLRQNNGLVVCGDFVEPEVHAVVQAINGVLGAAGKSVRYIPPVNAAVSAASLKVLKDDLDAGGVDVLLMFGGNPVYDAPADYSFAESLKKAKLRVHHTYYENETSQLCNWVLPATHALEEWGDARAYDGTVSMIQPIIAPLFEGRAAVEVFASLLGAPAGSYELVKGYWTGKLGGGDQEKAWRKFVHDGVLPNSASQAVGTVASLQSLETPQPASGIEIAFRPDPTIYDGRFSNNGWLQELPKPMTKMTWDNTAIISPKTAIGLDVVTDDLVRLTLGNTSVEAGVFVLPGQPDDVVTVNFGYGRTAGGIVATVKDHEGGGFDAYRFRTSNSPYYASGAKLEKAGGQKHLATTQMHQPIDTGPFARGLEGSEEQMVPGDHREVILEFTLADWIANGDANAAERRKQSEFFRRNDLYPQEIFEWEGEQWAMTIDLNTCIGCNACVTACQAENNIPVVGKEQVSRHREMHWLRIDRYYSGGEENPKVAWQPLACVHCEKAPCEPVCPVAATVHSHDGLNQMVYNRCVGTRYCSNNCPYKVRRFNYLNFTDNQVQFSATRDDKQRRPLLKMLNNPDVTVRGRGVMEKCTYCVQRINAARIESKKTNKPIKDGTILTACQQACPTETIVFGNQADKTSRVFKQRNDPRSYLLLEELNTFPRTSYLAKLRNPNPEIEPAVSTGGAH